MTQPHDVRIARARRGRIRTCLAAALLLGSAACKPGASQPVLDFGPVPADATWDTLTADINQAPYTNLTVVIGDKTGILYSYSKGSADLDRNLVIWSASKWVTSTMLLRLVDEGTLQLSDHPQPTIDWWVAGLKPNRLDLTLEQLLSFTSGMKDPSMLMACEFRPLTPYEDCAKDIYNNGLDFAPGTTYYYGGAHMHIAGLMAMKKLGVASFNDVFLRFKRDTGLFPQSGSAFKTPSTINPMPSGGLNTSAREYAEFLRQHLNRSLLSQTSYAKMYADHTAAPQVTISYSPVRDAYKDAEAVSQDWHYGLGVWLECPQAAWSASCAQNTIYSSAGAQGFYPYIDPAHGYYGVVATDESNPAQTAVKLMQPLRPLIESLVAKAHGG